MNVVYLQAERLFILELNIEFFAVVCEAFNRAYPDKEIADKTTIHRSVE
jgi:hypothetical protein